MRIDRHTDRYANNDDSEYLFYEKYIRKIDTSIYFVKIDTRTPNIDTVATPLTPNARSIYFCKK